MEVTPPVNTRAAGPADAAAITEVYFAAWHANLGHLFPAGAITSAERADRRIVVDGWLRDDDAMSVIVAVIDDAVVGYTAFEHDQVVHLFISPDAQGHGIGRRLLDEAVATLADRGVGRVRLFTLALNDKAIAFYTRLGWTLTDETKPGVYFGQPMHEVMLTKTASSG